jgi:hypothetical protein
MTGAGIMLPQPVNEILWSAKLDDELSKNHHLSGRFNVQRQSADNRSESFVDPESLLVSTIHDQTLSFGLTSSLTTQTSNVFRFFWHRSLNSLDSKSTQPGQVGAKFFRGANPCDPDPVRALLQLGVFGLHLLQDGDFGVGILP